MPQEDSSAINGVFLASFLQLLEQEQKSCTLLIAQEGKHGHLFLQEGELIDAETTTEIGLEAAYTILAWDAPSFKMADARQRARRIDQSLAYVLMNAAKKQDERNANEGSEVSSPSFSQAGPESPLLESMSASLKKIPGIRHYYILNRKGKIVASSEQNKKMGDFIAYCIVTGSQMRKTLNVKGPSRILLTLNNGHSLLLSSAAGMILGLLLNENVAAEDIFDQLRRAIAPIRSPGK